VEARKFFEQEFPDALVLMPTFNHDWENNKASSLVTISCFPFHFEDKATLIGDACHAMVPFFGQGMNASLQDCEVFINILQRENYDFGKALKAYSKERKPDADAICYLSYQNYFVMRSHVNSTLFLWRKKLELFLNWLLPDSFLPLYSMVSFTTIPYSQVITKAKTQDQMMDFLLSSFTVTVLGGSCWYLAKQTNLFSNLRSRL